VSVQEGQGRGENRCVDMVSNARLGGDLDKCLDECVESRRTVERIDTMEGNKKTAHANLLSPRNIK
jgi:hypothetical protein